MYSTTLLASLALIVGATANPLPAADPLPVEQSLKPRGSNAKVNQPITDAEWANLKSGGTLKPRSSTAKVNQPITDAEWANLKSGGLQTRNEESSLVVRDNVLNCGHLVTGTGGNAGHGVWIPVAQFADVANTFCEAYVGTDVALGHETSDTYPITLTNQQNPSQPGPAGNIVFAIYNTQSPGTYVVDHDTCLRALQAPLGSHAVAPPPGSRMAKRGDPCWGSNHNDYEGGYYQVNNIGAFGSEVYKAS